MTTTVQRGTVAADPAPPQPAPAEAAAKRPQRPARPGNAGRTELARTLAGTLLLTALVLLGFAGYLYGLSRLSEQRSQNTMYKTFAHRLSQAIAPVGPTAPGTPVAVMDIPSIGLTHLVVVEGTDARSLAMGPGHRRDTPLPGQAGVSVVYGRRATFGGPFARVPDLQRGALIYVTTGQGVSTYSVSSFGTGARPPAATSTDRLVLTTANSSLTPSSTVSVSATLTSTPQPSPGGLPGIATDEMSMHGAADASVLPLMLWGQALVVVAVIGTVATRRWAKWPAYVCIAPVALAVLWNVYENAAMLLPNVL